MRLRCKIEKQLSLFDVYGLGEIVKMLRKLSCFSRSRVPSKILLRCVWENKMSFGVNGVYCRYIGLRLSSSWSSDSQDELNKEKMAQPPLNREDIGISELIDRFRRMKRSKEAIQIDLSYLKRSIRKKHKVFEKKVSLQELANLPFEQLLEFFRYLYSFKSCQMISSDDYLNILEQDYSQRSSQDRSVLLNHVLLCLTDVELSPEQRLRIFQIFQSYLAQKEGDTFEIYKQYLSAIDLLERVAPDLDLFPIKEQAIIDLIRFEEQVLRLSLLQANSLIESLSKVFPKQGVDSPSIYGILNSVTTRTLLKNIEVIMLDPTLIADLGPTVLPILALFHKIRLQDREFDAKQKEKILILMKLEINFLYSMDFNDMKTLISQLYGLRFRKDSFDEEIWEKMLEVIKGLVSRSSVKTTLEDILRLIIKLLRFDYSFRKWDDTLIDAVSLRIVKSECADNDFAVLMNFLDKLAKLGIVWSDIPLSIQTTICRKIEILGGQMDLDRAQVIIDRLKTLKAPQQAFTSTLHKSLERLISRAYAHSAIGTIDYFRDLLKKSLLNELSPLSRTILEKFYKPWKAVAVPERAILLNFLYEELIKDEEDLSLSILHRLQSQYVVRADLPTAFDSYLIERITKTASNIDFDTLQTIFQNLSKLEYTWNDVPSIMKSRLEQFLDSCPPFDAFVLANAIALLSFDCDQSWMNDSSHPLNKINFRLFGHFLNRIDRKQPFGRNQICNYVAWISTFPQIMLDKLLASFGRKNLPPVKVQFYFDEEDQECVSVLESYYQTERDLPLSSWNFVSLKMNLEPKHSLPMHLAVQQDGRFLTFLHVIHRIDTEERERLSRKNLLREYVYRHHYPDVDFIRINGGEILSEGLKDDFLKDLNSTILSIKRNT